MQGNADSGDSRNETSLSIADFYGDSGEDEAFSESRFRESLAKELARDRIVTIEEPPPRGKGLRAPLIALVLSVVLASAAMALSINSARIEEQKFTFASSALYGTESLLIERLKQRSDIDISERDSMIEEYQNRSKLRAVYVQALSLVDEPAATVPDSAKAKAAQVALDRLSQDSSLDALYAEKLNATLAQVADDLRHSRPDTAAKTLDDMQATLAKSTSSSNSKSLQSALRITKALSASIDQAKNAANSNDPDEDAVIEALQSARADKISLLAQIQTLSEEKKDLNRKLEKTEAALLPESAHAEETLSIANFLGTVAIVEGNKVLVDIAQSARPYIGAPVVLFRPTGEGKGSIIDTATIRSLRASMAELALDELASADWAPKALDAVYMRRN